MPNENEEDMVLNMDKELDERIEAGEETPDQIGEATDQFGEIAVTEDDECDVVIEMLPMHNSTLQAQ